MRIGISTSVIQRGRTGVGQYLFALLREMLPYAAEHEFTLFVLEEDLPLFDFAQGRMRLEVVSERVRPPVKNILWHQAALPAIARRLGLDVLHIPSYRRMLGRHPCRLVATIHDLAPFRVPDKYDWKRMFYGRVVVARLARRQDHIIAVSENTASDLRQFFKLPSNKITVIHNGVDAGRFHPGSGSGVSDVVAKFGLNAPFFLYVARLEHPGKNHVRLIEAFEQFKAATKSNWLLVFGGSDWHGAEAIHQAINASRFKNDIRCLGFVSDDILPDLYRSAGAFVYPSLYEGFGMPPIEAMACGCPVICSTRGSLGEVVGDAAAIVEPDDIYSITRQLFVVANDAQVRNRLRAAGLARAREFDWARAAQQTLEVYHATSSTSTRMRQPLAANVAQGVP